MFQVRRSGGLFDTIDKDGLQRVSWKGCWERAFSVVSVQGVHVWDSDRDFAAAVMHLKVVVVTDATGGKFAQVGRSFGQKNTIRSRKVVLSVWDC